MTIRTITVRGLLVVFAAVATLATVLVTTASGTSGRTYAAAFRYTR